MSEPALGEIRLKWWGGALRGEHGGAPLAAALAETIVRFELPLVAFDNLLQARIFDLYDDPMPTVNDLEGYAGDTEVRSCNSLRSSSPGRGFRPWQSCRDLPAWRCR